MAPLTELLRCVLSQELIDKVIDESGDDFGSLKALSLVGRQCFPRTRKYLFRRIKLAENSNHPLDPATRCRRLLELLEANGSLRHHPQEVVIQSSTSDSENLELEPGWLQVCPNEAARILSMLQNVNAFVLERGERMMDFHHLPPPLRTALHSFMSRPTVPDVTVSGVNQMVFLPLFEHPTLKKLSILGLEVRSEELFQAPDSESEWDLLFSSDESSAALTSDTGKNFLEALDISLTGLSLASLLFHLAKHSKAVLKVDQIKTLAVGFLYFDISMAFLVWKLFLNKFCKNVDTFIVKQDPVQSLSAITDSPTWLDSKFFHRSIFPFYRLPCLKHLQVYVPHYYLPVFRRDPLPDFFDALDNLSSSGSQPVPLQTVEFGFDFTSLDVASEPVDVTTELNEISRRQDIWGDLNEILSRRPVFSQLTNVNLHMALEGHCTFSQSKEELIVLKNTIRSYMSTVEGQVQLTIVFHLPPHLQFP